MDKLPADYIESIEAIKAPTPDINADSVGGTVNMITKSAFAPHLVQLWPQPQDKRFAVFWDWTNALDQTVVRVQGMGLYRPQKIRYNGMRINLGISGSV